MVLPDQPAAAGVKSTGRMVPTRTVRQGNRRYMGGALPSSSALKSPSSASYWQSLTGIQLIKETWGLQFPSLRITEQCEMVCLMLGNNYLTVHSFGYSASTDTLLPHGLPHTENNFRLLPDKVQLPLHKWRCSSSHCISMSQQPSAVTVSTSGRQSYHSASSYLSCSQV